MPEADHLIQADLLSAPPDAALAEFVSNHLLMARQKSVAVVNGRRYVGMVRSEDLVVVPRRTARTRP